MLEVAKKKKQKKEKIVEKQKIEAIASKYQKARGGISLFNKKKENYKHVNKNKTDLDQVNNKYL